nr:MAG TPA: hypothetical protein [Caudoviricetes sp.]
MGASSRKDINYSLLTYKTGCMKYRAAGPPKKEGESEWHLLRSKKHL